MLGTGCAWAIIRRSRSPFELANTAGSTKSPAKLALEQSSATATPSSNARRQLAACGGFE
jgi:hypothetical protein